jgi:CO/xanthine dehydrogenase FAD-binding subunit
MLRLPKFHYVAPTSLEDAIRLRADDLDSSMYVAGGTDVYPKMKRCASARARHLRR